nr:hypothetical protein [Acidobacteriota bacterium]
PLGVSGRVEPGAITAALASIPAGEPTFVLLAASPWIPLSPADREALRGTLSGAAARQPLVVVVDDGWEGVAAEEAPSTCLFWDLVGCHPNLIPVKVDGADRSFPGGAIGFLTFPFAPGSGLAEALEMKVKMLLRAAVGSPSAVSQTLLVETLAAGHRP